MNIPDTIARELGLRHNQVARTLELFGEGATLPFVARYRKEATGGLDEVQLEAVRERAKYFEELEARKETVLASIESQEKLTDELRARITGCMVKTELEDLYLPYKPKRVTRGAKAIARGLLPLAERILAQEPRGKEDPETLAAGFVDAEQKLPTTKEVWAGARAIIAERLADDAELRAVLRDLFARTADLRAAVIEGQEEAGKKYRDYFDYRAPLAQVPSHRLLAIRRAEKEEVLTLSIEVDDEQALGLLRPRVITRAGAFLGEQLELALGEAYRRSLMPAMVVEARMRSKEKADAEAITVFAKNLRALLLSPPLGSHAVLGIDPGLRTGCKLVALSRTGALLAHDVIFPLAPRNDTRGAADRVAGLCAAHAIGTIAVGNGTGGREVESLFRGLAGSDPRFAGVTVVSVNEAGASVYSASKVAREEFPDHDVTVRGAVSIGRRLQDPLAELVKIEPKAIGVGQYQHDVDQRALKDSLDGVVVSCVNAVGVELNTASSSLLSYVSGLSRTRAERIVALRDSRGPFQKREQLLDVSGLGPKTFQQCAGFLRVRDGAHPLDNTGVHPERYALVERMARDLGLGVEELVGDAAAVGRLQLSRYVEGEVGLPTLEDIRDELLKPGRDPRESFEAPRFDPKITSLKDLAPGQILEGVVSNVTRFGLFVDVGVKRDGLVHVSELAWRYIDDATEFAKVGEKVKVKVLSVDHDRQRLSLSIKQLEPRPVRAGGGRRGGQGGGPRGGSGPRGGGRPREQKSSGNTLGRYLRG